MSCIRMLPTDYHTTCLKIILSIYLENGVTLSLLVNYTNSLMKITFEYNGSKTFLFYYAIFTESFICVPQSICRWGSKQTRR